jgi:hypothetical protein
LDWPGKRISWRALMVVVNKEFEGTWARRSVAKYPKLQRAFRDTQKRLKEAASGKPYRNTVDVTLDVLQRQVRDLREENEELRKKLAVHQERFTRWKTNAYLSGRITAKELDAPLQPIDRGRSDT